MAVDLYHVSAGPQVWRYTSGEFDVQTATDLWEAKPIKRQDLSYDLKQTGLSIILPDDVAPFDIFKTITPLLPITVIIYDYPTMGVKFKGDIKGVSYDATKSIATVSIGSTKFLGDTTAPNRTYSQSCPFDLYGQECGVDRAAYTITVANSTVNWIAPDKLENPAFAGQNLINGYIELDTGESQFITAQSGGTLQLLWAVATRDDAVTVKAVANCMKSTYYCDTYFNNLPNYGGFPYIPTKNPATEGY